MTPRELDLMRQMLREEIEPVRNQVADLATRTKALEEADKTFKTKLSGQHRAVTKELIPQLRSEAEAIRKGDMGAVADAFNRMGHVVADLAETASRIEQNSNRSLVELPDGKGGTSVRPASLVAAESSVRAENNQAGLAKVVLGAAIDTTTAKDTAASVKVWQKRVTTPILVLMPIAVELVHQLWPIIFK